MKAIIQFIMSLFKKSDNHVLPTTPENSESILEEIKKPLPKATAEETILEYQLEGNITKEVLDKKTPDLINPVAFKTDRIGKEYLELQSKNSDLFNLLQDLNDYVNRTFKKQLILTMIDRTQAEQDYLYRNSARYKKKKFKSPHQFWHAVDIRSFIFTRAEIKRIENYLNKKYDGKNHYRWTAKCHEVGNNGMHFHIQFVMKASLKKKGEEIVYFRKKP